MLNIYYGRESIDKEKFIYESIAESSQRTLVIVPDQYTLEAEKQAFRYLGAKGLLNVEIISMSRLGSRLLAQHGGAKRTFIDKYGRHMILSRIVGECKEEMQVFGATAEKTAFLEKINNFISEMKQYNVSLTDLQNLAEQLQEGSLLHRKISDLHLIYSRYQKAIGGKYTDAEDLIDLYMEKIPQSEMLKESQIWVYGFDSFAPKAMTVLGNIMSAAKDFHVVLTYDRNCIDEEIFRLPEIVMNNLEKQAEGFGLESRRYRIDDRYIVKKSAGIREIERQLYGAHIEPVDRAEGITLVEAANFYGEAESAAAHILHLIRDKGMRYRDIVVICNDQKKRGAIARRVFEEYGMQIFDDKKRTIISSPISIFVTALVETALRGYRTAELLQVLKSGFVPLDSEEVEDLENYAVKYRIHGTMWKKPFVKGGMEYGEDGMHRLNLLRERAVAPVLGVETLLKEQQTIRAFIEGYYDYLVEVLHLDREIMKLMEQQEQQGYLETAEETGQVWGCIVNLLDQILELCGDEPFEADSFVNLFEAGLSQMEVGVLPPTSDDILMGTMQRTRSGQTKAMVIIGANEGVLPAKAPDEGLFTLDELTFLSEGQLELCKNENIRVWEEQLAIYRNLSKATEDLWVSYALSGDTGEEERPSEIIDVLKRIFPQLIVQKDVLNRQQPEDLIGGRINTLRHLTKALQSAAKGEDVHGLWNIVLNWYRLQEPLLIAGVLEGLDFTNKQSDLPENLAEMLYKRDHLNTFILSPSRLERFSRCPFAHFVTYGLRPEERRVFEAADREIGDIHHQCLMKVSEQLTKEGCWETITEDACRDLVEKITRGEAEQYREGVFRFSNEEKYKLQRIEETCFHVCWTLIQQVRSGAIEESRYEVPFGRASDIPPITVNCGEKEVYIEGKIDRLDVITDQRVKIIDYKTGPEYFNIDEARGGYRLQLMLYLKAAQQQQKKPAGVFYFLINEPKVDLTETSKEKVFEKISKEMKKSYRLNGIMVDDRSVIQGIAGEFSGHSDIVPIQKKADGTIKGNSAHVLLSEEEFFSLQEDVDRQIDKLCRQLVEGRIAIHPKKTQKTSPCVHCQYHSICRFDTAFDGCNYDVIK